ncbi:galactose oxidase [Gigaspora margarita]|uniref:Galactose oxidase n=1 Tax=Gigaspora margarita TaxID=4874 RepID=A0A8H4ESQ5_GIGMA|nr:galactose oxidase [Gigaspora margarita]
MQYPLNTIESSSDMYINLHYSKLYNKILTMKSFGLQNYKLQPVIMMHNSLHSTLFCWAIILLFLFVNCQNIPNPRYEQTSSLIGNRLYFFGGDLSTDYKNDSAANLTNEVWYLDLSSSFNTTTPPWRKDVGMQIGYNFGALCVSPIDNSGFLVGGRMYIPNSANINLGSSPVYVFNSNISLWATPNIIGFNSSFKMRNQIQTVIDNYGKIYIFGGTNYTGLDTSYLVYTDMSILDTTSMIRSTLDTPTNGPPPYLSYTATLLSTGIIVYIGGYKLTLPFGSPRFRIVGPVIMSGSSSFLEPVSMYEIQTFNTKNYSWSTKVVGGDTIGTHAHHSAILTQNGEIIIYGGSVWNDTLIPAAPYIAKLDTSSWMLSIANLSQINSPQLCEDYMIIAFGNYCIMLLCRIPSKSSMSYSALSNNVYILDIKSYTWITSFNPNQSTSNQTFPPNKSSTNQTPFPDNHINNDLFIGIGVGAGIVLLGVFSVVGFLLYKRKRQNQNPKFIPTPSTTDRI